MNTPHITTSHKIKGRYDQDFGIVKIDDSTLAANKALFPHSILSSLTNT